MEEETEISPIMLMPNEILAMIVQNLRCRDIVSFGSTCKHFNKFIEENQYIWKEKMQEILPSKITDVIYKYGKKQYWLDEIKSFYCIKRQVHDQLMEMSPKYYWRTTDLTMEDINIFFDYALYDPKNYYYVICVLQDAIEKGTKFVEYKVGDGEKPFTMTELYYAKITIRFLTHSFLAMKWALNKMRNELTPEFVLNFFVHWTDPASSLYSDKTAEECIDKLVQEVEAMFPNNASTKKKGWFKIRDKLAHDLINEKQVLEAVSDVIYEQHELAIILGASLDGLSIVKACQTKRCHLIVAAVLYQAVARNCGVHCELIAFPNHLFLEWRSTKEMLQSYKIDLETGALVPQGRCPFAPSTFRQEYKFNPEGFVQYVVSAFLLNMGAIKNWYSQNAVYLLDFLSNNVNDNPYRDFLPYLHVMLDFKRLPELNRPVILEYIHEKHLKVLEALSNLNKTTIPYTREMEVKHRDSSLKFAVGMLAYHNKFDYLCVVRGWDLKCTTDWRRSVELKDLKLGSQQPFYNIIAVDQSERYVAQENLIPVDRPTRLYHLEDVIAKEFKYFDGYCYIPNDEKQKEYPDDEAIRLVYRARGEQKVQALRNAL